MNRYTPRHSEEFEARQMCFDFGAACRFVATTVYDVKKALTAWVKGFFAKKGKPIMATVIQTTETGEEFAIYTNSRPDLCDDWIEANADKYPESKFRVIDRYETNRYPLYYPE